jgi:hypothetical protein
VIDPGAQDDHRAAVCEFGVARELTRDQKWPGEIGQPDR